MRRSLTALFVLTGLAVATPAHATLLVRSDSTGQLVQDKNGIGDNVDVFSTTKDGLPAYQILNNNAFDVFKFDRQANCFAGSSDSRSVCKKFGTKLNLAMGGGDDDVGVAASGAGFVSANLGSGSDEYDGIGATDNVFASSGNDVVDTGGGNDDITIGSGEDTVDASTGNDEIDSGIGSAETGKDEVSPGPGTDVVDLDTPFQEGPALVVDAAGDDTILTGDGNDDIAAGVGSIASISASGASGTDEISTKDGDDDIVAKEGSTTTRAADNVQCGFGEDRVEADLTDVVDSISNPGGGTCEQVERSAIGETPHVRFRGRSLHVSRTGVARVRLRCPHRTTIGCRGTLSLRLARRGARRPAGTRYAIRRGRSAAVRVRLTRREARRTRRARGVLVSLEKGRLGPKTTVRSPRLR